MAFPLIPLIAGLASVGGAVAQNRANSRQAQRQMDFQREMSNTAVSRSVEDYRNAGLNPALAYERSASSPTGASATLGDPVASGISSAQSAAALKAQLEMQRDQTDAQVRLNTSLANKAAVEGANALIDGNIKRIQERMADREDNFLRIVQPFQQRTFAAQALAGELTNQLSAFQIPGARNNARLDTKLGIARPIIGDILSGIKAAAPLLMRR